MKVEEVNVVFYFTLGNIARFEGCVIYDNYRRTSIINGDMFIIFHYIEDVWAYDKYVEESVCSIVNRFIPDDEIESDRIPVNVTIIVKEINDKIKFIKSGNVQVELTEDRKGYLTKLQI